jgi:hypothetical protein
MNSRFNRNIEVPVNNNSRRFHSFFVFFRQKNMRRKTNDSFLKGKLFTFKGDDFTFFSNFQRNVQKE